MMSAPDPKRTRAGSNFRGAAVSPIDVTCYRFGRAPEAIKSPSRFQNSSGLAPEIGALGSRSMIARAATRRGKRCHMGLTKDEAFAAVFSDPFGGGTIRPYDYLAAAGYNQWGFVTAYHEPDPRHVVGCLAIGQGDRSSGMGRPLRKRADRKALLVPGHPGYRDPGRRERACWAGRKCLLGQSRRCGLVAAVHRRGRDHNKCSTTRCLRAVRRCSGTSRGC